MPFTTVPDKASGAVFTEANWDTDIAANLNSGFWVPLGKALPLVGALQVDFVSVPSGFSALLVTAWARNTGVSTGVSLRMRFNDDSGNNYDRVYMGADGNVADQGESLAVGVCEFGATPGASSPTNHYGGAWALIPAYDQTDRHKFVIVASVWHRAYASLGGTVRYEAADWRSTAAITKVTVLYLTGGFAAGSVVNLYGLAVT
jgi:hypothetical protein